MGYVDGQTVIREHYHDDAAPKYLLVCAVWQGIGCVVETGT